MPDASFSTATRKIAEASVLAHLHIFLQFARQDEIGGCIDGEVKFRHTDENIIEADRSRQVSEFGSTGDWFQSLRELADVGSIVILLNMLTTTSYGNAVEDFKEIEAQHFEQCLCGSFLGRKFRPTVERGLSLTENIVERA